MKTITTLLAVAMSLTACQNSSKEPLDLQTKLEEIVKETLTKNVNDPKSLEVVSISKYENGYTSYYETQEHYDLNAQSDSLSKALGVSSSVPELEKISKMFYKNLESDSLGTINYKGKLDKYIIDASFRAKNGFGALVLQTQRFVFDTNCVVQSAAILDKNAQ